MHTHTHTKLKMDLINSNFPIVQLTVHITNSRKTQRHRAVEAWIRTLGCSLPNSSDKYPRATGQSIIMTEMKGSLDAAFFNSMNPLLHTKFMP